MSIFHIPARLEAAADWNDLHGVHPQHVSTSCMIAWAVAERRAAEVDGDHDLNPSGKKYNEPVDKFMADAGFGPAVEAGVEQPDAVRVAA